MSSKFARCDIGASSSDSNRNIDGSGGTRVNKGNRVIVL
jgi:hypothetical protein